MSIQNLCQNEALEVSFSKQRFSRSSKVKKRRKITCAEPIYTLTFDRGWKVNKSRIILNIIFKNQIYNLFFSKLTLSLAAREGLAHSFLVVSHSYFSLVWVWAEKYKNFSSRNFVSFTSASSAQKRAPLILVRNFLDIKKIIHF